MTRALIVGAGIGGLAAAIALERAGMEVQVFERVSEIREVGAGISLWANAIRALDTLGVRAAIEQASVAYDIGGLCRADGAVLSSISASELQRLLGTPVIVVHRADLLAALLAAVPATAIGFGSACTGVVQDGSGVEAHFADGGRTRGDVLIGADGLHSVVRAAVHGAAPPRYAGCTAWRAVVPFGGKLAAAECWGGGTLFGRVPISGNRVYWYAAKTAPQGEPSTAPKAELRQLFKGWHAPVGDLIEAADEAEILRNDIYDRPPLETWGRGRISLVGDAAHPMTPFLGQGACQALEDAVALGRCLAGRTDPVAALRDYEQRRISRANAFVIRSRRVGQLALLKNPALVAIRNAVLKRVSPTLQARQLAAMIGAPT